MTTTSCAHCGAALPSRASFCTGCGTGVAGATSTVAPTAVAAATHLSPTLAPPPLLPPPPPFPPLLPPPPPFHAGQVAGMAPMRSGKLLASGVLSIITGSVYLLMAIMTMSMKDTIFGDMVDDATGVLTLMLLIFLGLGGAFIAAGIGACQSKAWAQIATLAIGGISLLFFLIVLIGSGEASILIPLLWFGLIVGLAVAVKPAALARFTAPRV